MSSGVVLFLQSRFVICVGSFLCVEAASESKLVRDPPNVANN